ncbi:MAG: hypothetical protein LBS93_08970 [Synergistaceae bacterium]|jgi:protein-S-isoprenylcysteine O-methyltransferase Ste14|nr:hypothetical protein [Synergistaceae bacterium]
MTFGTRIPYVRVSFWISSTVCYWWLIYVAERMTRLRAFVVLEIVEQIADNRSLSAIRENMGAIETQAWQNMMSAGSMPGEYLSVALLMGLVLISAPFFVRLDYRAPIRGIFLLPIAILLSYIFVSLLNIVIATGMGWALSLSSSGAPGAEPGSTAGMLALIAHPLYLFAPQLMRSVPGTLSQLLYTGFIFSVLTMPGMDAEDADLLPDAGEVRHYRGIRRPEIDGDDWSKAACTMEMERTAKLLETSAISTELVGEIKTELSDYINRSSFIDDDLESGATHYEVILTQTAGFLRRMIIEDRSQRDCRNALLIVSDEMARMEYVAPEEREKTRAWLSTVAPDTDG